MRETCGDGGFVGEIVGYGTVRGPTIESHFAGDLQVVADLCSLDGGLVKADVIPVNQHEGVALPGVPPGLQRRCKALPEFVARQAVGAVNPQAVVGLQTDPTPPLGRAGRTGLVAFGNENVAPAVGDSID